MVVAALVLRIVVLKSGQIAIGGSPVSFAPDHSPTAPLERGLHQK